MSGEIKNRTVYMLCRVDGGNDVYVGSTSKPLGERFSEHKCNAGNPSRLKYHGTSKLYERMRDVGVHRWKIISLSTFACGRKTICEFEREWVKALGASLNTYSPFNEDRREYRVNYYKKNKEEKRYYCEICDVAFMHNSHLKTHLDTYKHFMNWVWDID